MKRFAALCLALCLILAGALAVAEGITVSKRDMTLNRSLDKNVNNVLILIQDGGLTDTMLVASINSRTGRSVMTEIRGGRKVNLPEVGEVAIEEVYALGAEKSKGFLAARTVNALLDLNITTYVVMDLQNFPALVDEIGKLATWLNEAEAAILNTWAGDNRLTSENVLTYIDIRLEEDYEEKNRCYMVFMDLLKQGLRKSGSANLMGLGKKLLDGMDTNLSALAAVTMLGSFRSGDDRRELYLAPYLSEEEMRERFHQEVYGE